MDINVVFQKELLNALIAFTKDKPFWESQSFVVLLTGILTIASALLGRYQAFRLQERQSEIEKQLRIHALQLEALKNLSEIECAITPVSEPIQGADSHEWLSTAVPKLRSVVEELGRYLQNYAYLSPAPVLEQVGKAIEIANEHKWEYFNSDQPSYEPSKEVINGANDLIKVLRKAVRLFKIHLGIETKLASDHE